MASYSLSVRVGGSALGTPLVELRAGATGRPRLLELGVQQAQATAAGVYGLGRAAAQGTPLGTTSLVAESDDAAPASLAQIAVAWSIAPTAPSNYLRRSSENSATGVGVVWTFGAGVSVPVSSSLALWALATSPIVELWLVVDE